MRERQKNRGRSKSRQLVAPITTMATFLVVALLMWWISGILLFFFLFFYIGAMTMLGMLLYIFLPQKRKNIGRKLTFILIGLALLVTFIFSRDDVQIEGFFFGTLSGLITSAVIHYLVGKIVGPLVFHRNWCGWACWTLAVVDFLPYKKSKGRLQKGWGFLRYLHFLLSLGLVLTLFFLFSYQKNLYIYDDGVFAGFAKTGMFWFIGGNALYYLTALILALTLKDNRAFCKYVCPITIFFKATSRFSLLKVRGNAQKCTDCGACVKACPMDILITDYTKDGRRVLSSECIMCLTCTETCPNGALDVSLDIDVGVREKLRGREE